MQKDLSISENDILLDTYRSKIGRLGFSFCLGISLQETGVVFLSLYAGLRRMLFETSESGWQRAGASKNFPQEMQSVFSRLEKKKEALVFL